ncbi:hypothetical protein TRFO_38581 [Tritrichomonas foetus]|uniref:Uncharacterized protein n=1 Tax=Tritrichomonas foetus TaxID=1144522 RepID=A0A1J4J9H6_9EUKA|nr:hypothetical protein TRFO_38581 [Tritrichomonas foetus]|eukprot:OHS95313.1 hypothetical protein TRFO_38581 [Tritrichomonas foetus]
MKRRKISNRDLSTASTDNRSFAIYERRKTTANIVYQTTTLIILFAAGISIYEEIRAASLSSVYSMNKEHITAHSISYAYTIDENLLRYEISSQLMASLSDETPYLVHCDRDHIFYYIAFTNNVNRFSNPMPYRYYITHDGVGGCQIEYNMNNLSQFDLYYMFPYNSTHDQVRKFNESINYLDWDPNTEGIFINYITINESNFRFKEGDYQKTLFWTSGIARFGGQTDPRVFTNFKPVWRNDIQATTAAGSSIYLVDLYNMIKKRTQASHSRYIMTDSDYNVLIDDRNGALMPLDIVNYQPIFPKIYQLEDEVWRNVSMAFDIPNLPIDIPEIVNVSNDESGVVSQYVIMKRVMHTRSLTAFYLIMVFELDQIIENIYFKITVIFICCFIAVILSIGMIKVLMYRNTTKRDNKLFCELNNGNQTNNLPQNQTKPEFEKNDENDMTNKRQLTLISSNVNNLTNNNSFYFHNRREFGGTKKKKDNFYFGNISKAISRLRNVELNYPEDSMLNRAFDRAVNELARIRSEIFNVEYKKIESNQKSTKNVNLTQNSNQNQNNCEFCSFLNHDFLIVQEFEDTKKNNSKNKKTSKTPFSIWQMLNHKFEYRANSFIKDNLLKNDPEKYIIIMFLKLIQKEKLFFPGFDPDLLIIFLLSFLTRKVTAPYTKIESFKFAKKLILDQFKEWIPLKFDVFILFFVKIVSDFKMKRANEVLKKFHEIIHTKNDYFDFVVTKLIEETSNHNKMNVYGEFCNRIQSSDFSISNNLKDKFLFLKVICIFSDFAPYFLDCEENACYNEINNHIFTTEERNDINFVKMFHAEMATNVVKPWLMLISKISNLALYEDNLNSTIDYWKGEVEESYNNG